MKIKLDTNMTLVSWYQWLRMISRGWIDTCIFLLLFFSLFNNIISCQKTRILIEDILIPEWQDGEHIYYGITLSDTLIGNVRFSIYFDMEGDVPVYILENITDTEGEEGFIFDSSVVCFRRSDFAPIWAWRKVESDFGYRIVETHYDELGAEMWLETVDGRESADIPISYPYFDNEMILTILRAVRFSIQKNYGFDVVIPLTFEKTFNNIKYSGEKSIAVPAGLFECERILMTNRRHKFYIFYEQQEPKRLIRYQGKNSKYSLVLLNNKQN